MASEAAPDATDPIRVQLNRALWRAIEASPRTAAGARPVAQTTPGQRPADGPIETAARDAIRAACVAARERDVQAERLLVQLKEAWARVPQAERDARGGGDAILARVVTLCIVEFYASAGAHRGQAGGRSETGPASDV